MCDPISLSVATFAISAGGTLVEANQKNQQAKGARSAARAAEDAANADISQRSIEERLVARQQIAAGVKQTAEASADVATGAASSGVAGNSIDALLINIAREGSAYTQGVNDQADANVGQLDRQRAAVHADALNRINANAPVSPWVTALQIGGAAVGSYSNYIGMTRPPVVSSKPKP